MACHLHSWLAHVMGSALSGPWDIPAKSLRPMVSGSDCFENFGAYAVPKHSLNHELEADHLFASHTSTEVQQPFSFWIPSFIDMTPSSLRREERIAAPSQELFLCKASCSPAVK